MLRRALHSVPRHARAAALAQYVDTAHARCQPVVATTDLAVAARVVTMRDTRCIVAN
jgi:hypothetical protein